MNMNTIKRRDVFGLLAGASALALAAPAARRATHITPSNQALP